MRGRTTQGRHPAPGGGKGGGPGTPRRWLARTLAPLLWLTFVVSAAASPYDRPTVLFPDDPFAVQSTNDHPGWVKFLIMVDDPGTVIFQDSQTYPFHYDFAVNEIEAFAGMTPAQFDAATLYESGQLAHLGAVVFPPLVGYEHVYPEYGIQFVRHDPYAPTLLRDLFNVVRAGVIAGPEVQPYYFPTYEQQASAEQNAAWLESQGIFISSTDRWADGNSCYSDGWALGELKYFETGQIDAAYLAGNLLPGDILLTDAVPAEIPFVAGVISLAPATPSSHVAILAQTFGVPFVHLALAEDVQRAQDLLGHEIVLRAYGFDRCYARLIDVEGILDQATIDEILALKDPPELTIPKARAYAAYSASTDALPLSYLRFFGGKSVHFSLLRQALPASSPVATAFAFNLWLDFMDQTLTTGRTLREEIDLQLAPFSYPPDMQALANVLDGIRDLIKDTDETSFDPAGESAVLATLQDPQYGFDPYAKLRFRSSTNVEDSEHFTGAGLYNSYSGCLADDLDGDSVGPSHCDPDENKERGVFRAIRKVFASFYNLNAYLERLRHGLDEHDLGMALLVHHSFPDAIELANGVGTLVRSGTYESGQLVLQVGATSVTNPDPGVIPEEVEFSVHSNTVYPTLIRQSNLLPLGATVLEFPLEYEALGQHFRTVADQYQTATGDSSFALEFEYKKLTPGDDLILKQVRPLPGADSSPSVTPFLINEPVEYCVFQGEFGDVFANHRLKSRWSMETGNLWLTEENLQQDTILREVTLEYNEACQVYQQTGLLSQWPSFTHTYSDGTAVEGWRFDSLQNPRSYELTIASIPTLVAPRYSPIFVLSDFYCLPLRVEYDNEVPFIDYFGPGTRTAEDVRLCACPTSHIGDLLQQRQAEDGGGVSVDTRFYWPPHPEGFTAGYTAPLIRFVETTIAGLTSTPILLSDVHSQSHRPGHHNFDEFFIFDPFLEPGLPTQQLDELTTAGVRVIYLETGPYGPDPVFVYYDEDGWGDACLDCSGFDGDQDGFCTGEPTFDCDDANAGAWATPGETLDLVFTDATHLAWSPPADPGGDLLAYDLLRAGAPDGFQSAGTCVEWDDGQDTLAEDPAQPPPGSVYYYVSRAINDCPESDGSIGTDYGGIERPARPCP